MAVSGKAKERLAQLVRDLGMGHVVQGVLHYPTAIDGHGIGSTDLEYFLSRFLDREVILIVMPIGGPRSRLRSPDSPRRGQAQEDYPEGGAA